MSEVPLHHYLRILKYTRWYATLGGFLEEPSALLVRPHQRHHCYCHYNGGLVLQDWGLVLQDSCCKNWVIGTVRIMTSVAQSRRLTFRTVVD